MAEGLTLKELDAKNTEIMDEINRSKKRIESLKHQLKAEKTYLRILEAKRKAFKIELLNNHGLNT